MDNKQFIKTQIDQALFAKLQPEWMKSRNEAIEKGDWKLAYDILLEEYMQYQRCTENLIALMESKRKE